MKIPAALPKHTLIISRICSDFVAFSKQEYRDPMPKNKGPRKQSRKKELIPKTFRELAFVILRDYRDRDIFLADSLNQWDQKQNFDRSLFRQAQELSFGTIRRSGTLQHLIKKFSETVMGGCRTRSAVVTSNWYVSDPVHEFDSSTCSSQ